MACAETDLEAEVDPSVETEEKLRAEEEAARQRLEAMQRCASFLWCCQCASHIMCTLCILVINDLHSTAQTQLLVPAMTDLVDRHEVDRAQDIKRSFCVWLCVLQAQCANSCKTVCLATTLA